MILFELLSGHSPYGESPSPLQIVQALLHGEAPTPSSVAPPAVVPSSVVGIPGRRLRGDLDAIVGKCLRRSPDERYASAGELETEIRAHLARRPIAARKGVAYRLARRLRRQVRGIVAAGLLLGSLGGTWWQHERAEGRLEVADRAAEDAASTPSSTAAMPRPSSMLAGPSTAPSTVSVPRIPRCTRPAAPSARCCAI